VPFCFRWKSRFVENHIYHFNFQNTFGIMTTKTTSIILTIFFISLILGFMTYFKYMQDNHLKNLPVLGEEGHRVGAFSLQNQNGDTITEKTVANKIRVVEFFFSTCKGICPVMNENMNKVYNEYRNDKDIIILSHTVNPEIDTVDQLNRYAEKFDAAANKWLFLTGKKSEIYTMAINSYLIKAGDSAVTTVLPDFIHDERFALIDKDNRIRGRFYDGTNEADVQQLIGDIKALKKEYE
jgi:protein SCO1